MKLYKTRQLPLPTWQGWLLVLTLFGLCSVWAWRNLAFYLSPHAPQSHELLVVEGWLEPHHFEQVMDHYRQLGYQHVVTTGGVIHNTCLESDQNYAERARRLLMEMGIAADNITALPQADTAQERTFFSAVSLREWNAQQEQPYASLDIATAGPHARRTRYLFSLAFRETLDDHHIGIIRAEPIHYTLSHWWQNSLGAKAVITEAAAWFFTLVFFEPGEIGSKWEKWAVK